MLSYLFFQNQNIYLVDVSISTPIKNFKKAMFNNNVDIVVFLKEHLKGVPLITIPSKFINICYLVKNISYFYKILY